jgi:hypothetical protein
MSSLLSSFFVLLRLIFIDSWRSWTSIDDSVPEIHLRAAQELQDRQDDMASDVSKSLQRISELLMALPDETLMFDNMSMKHPSSAGSDITEVSSRMLAAQENVDDGFLDLLPPAAARTASVAEHEVDIEFSRPVSPLGDAFAVDDDRPGSRIIHESASEDFSSIAEEEEHDDERVEDSDEEENVADRSSGNESDFSGGFEESPQRITAALLQRSSSNLEQSPAFSDEDDSPLASPLPLPAASTPVPRLALAGVLNPATKNSASSMKSQHLDDDVPHFGDTPRDEEESELIERLRMSETDAQRGHMRSKTLAVHPLPAKHLMMEEDLPLDQLTPASGPLSTGSAGPLSSATGSERTVSDLLSSTTGSFSMGLSPPGTPSIRAKFAMLVERRATDPWSRNNVHVGARSPVSSPLTHCDVVNTNAGSIVAGNKNRHAHWASQRKACATFDGTVVDWAADAIFSMQSDGCFERIRRDPTWFGVDDRTVAVSVLQKTKELGLKHAKRLPPFDHSLCSRGSEDRLAQPVA